MPRAPELALDLVLVLVLVPRAGVGVGVGVGAGVELKLKWNRGHKLPLWHRRAPEKTFASPPCGPTRSERSSYS